MNTRGRFFSLKNKEALQEMLNMRRNGMSFVAIGRCYGKDHTTIMHHCKKYNVLPMNQKERKIFFEREVRQIEKPIQLIVPRHKYADLLEEPINLGKRSYRDYLKSKKMKLTVVEL